MHPILFKIGNFALYSWGVAFSLSVLAGIGISLKRAPHFGIDPNVIIDLSVVVMISAMLGSRLWYVLWHLDLFKGKWLTIVNPFQDGKIGISGFSMTGGVVLALLASFVYAWIRQLHIPTLGDAITPVFLLGAGIHRLGGCFLSGCCFGVPTKSFLGIVFPPEVGASLRFPGEAVWPTQLFASALGFAGFVLVLWLERRRSFPGYTFWQVFMYYPVDRFIVDQFRYYGAGQILGKLGPFTINVHHPVLAGVFILSVVFWFRGWRKRKNSFRQDKQD